jgi:hypothetical protein
MGARNRVGIRVVVPARQATLASGINSSEPIPGLLKSLKIRALAGRYDNSIPARFLAPIDCLKIPTLTKMGTFLAESRRLHLQRPLQGGRRTRLRHHRRVGDGGSR